jgi:hypothetical protein
MAKITNYGLMTAGSLGKFLTLPEAENSASSHLFYFCKITTANHLKLLPFNCAAILNLPK